MKITLIHTVDNQLLDPYIDPPFGLICIGTILEQAGHEVTIQLVDANNIQLNDDALVYGMSLYTPSYTDSLKILDWLNKRGKIVVAGGPHATALPVETFGDRFDVVVTNECEGNICSIFSLAVDKHYRGIVEGHPVNDLDKLPYWDYSLVDMSEYHRVVDNKVAVSYMTSRGCAYRCLFCWVANNQQKVRYHSVERVINELKLNKATTLRIFDDHFAINRKRFWELTSRLQELGQVSYRCTPRISDLTKEVCQQLKNTGCVLIIPGVESGSDEILLRMNKQITTRQIKENIENAKAAGLSVRISLIIGFPGETWGTIKEGVCFLKTVPFDEFAVSIFVPFPGTYPYHYPNEFGITWMSKDWNDYHILKGEGIPTTVFETAELSKQTLHDMWRYTREELFSVGKVLNIHSKENK